MNKNAYNAIRFIAPAIFISFFLIQIINIGNLPFQIETIVNIGFTLCALLLLNGIYTIIFLQVMNIDPLKKLRMILSLLLVVGCVGYGALTINANPTNYEEYNTKLITCTVVSHKKDYTQDLFGDVKIFYLLDLEYEYNGQTYTTTYSKQYKENEVIDDKIDLYINVENNTIPLKLQYDISSLYILIYTLPFIGMFIMIIVLRKVLPKKGFTYDHRTGSYVKYSGSDPNFRIKENNSNRQEQIEEDPFSDYYNNSK